jgi:DnaK suppressor protein
VLRFRSVVWADAVLSAKKTETFRNLLQSRIADAERTISAALKETKAYAGRQADPADQAANEYERQAALHRADAAREKLKVLKQALQRLQAGTYGECSECGGDIEQKRLEAVPWATHCVKCQEAREQG